MRKSTLKKLISLTATITLFATTVGQYSPITYAKVPTETSIPLNTSDADATTIDGQETKVFTFTLGDTKKSLMSAKRATLGPEGSVSLIDGTAVNWIDRIALPQYAYDAYDILVEASDNDGNDDFMIDEACLTESNSLKFFQFKVYSLQSETELQTAEQNRIIQNISAAFLAFDQDHPEIFWYSKNYSVMLSWSQEPSTEKYTYDFYYNVYPQERKQGTNDLDYTDTANIKEAINQRNNKVTEIIQAANQKIETDGLMNHSKEYNLVSYFNDYLIKNNSYSSDSDKTNFSNTSRTSWKCLSALLGNDGLNGPVCEGYSRAFKVLCDASNIPCVLVTGDAGIDNKGPHMWNYVEIPICSEKKWYAMDTTWNDTTNHETDYFLVGENTSITGTTFKDTHNTTNKPSNDINIAFTNGPTLSSSSYSEDYATMDPSVNSTTSPKATISPTPDAADEPNTTEAPATITGTPTLMPTAITTSTPQTIAPTQTAKASEQPEKTEKPIQTIQPTKTAAQTNEPKQTVTPTITAKPPTTKLPSPAPTTFSAQTVIPNTPPTFTADVPKNPVSATAIVTTGKPSPTISVTKAPVPTLRPPISTPPITLNKPISNTVVSCGAFYLYDNTGHIIGYCDRVPCELDNTDIDSSSIDFIYDSNKKLQSITVNLDFTPIFSSDVIITNEILNQLKEYTNNKDFNMVIRRIEDETTLYTLCANSKLFGANSELYIVKAIKGTKVLYNSKTYETSSNRTLCIDLAANDGGTYTLVTPATKKAMVTKIKKTISLKKSKIMLSKKKSYTITTKNKINKCNIKSVTYKSTNKKIASVTSKGKVTVKGKGSCSIKVTYTLKDNSKKTLSLKVTTK